MLRTDRTKPLQLRTNSRKLCSIVSGFVAVCFGMQAARSTDPPGRGAAKLLVAVALSAVYIIWGSTYLAMRIALEGFPPFFMGGIRFLVAGTLLYSALKLRGAITPTFAQWRSSSYVGVLLLLLGNGFVAVAEHHGVSSAVAATVVATMPLWMVFFGTLWGERPAPRDIIGLLIGFSGVLVLRAGGSFAAPLIGIVSIMVSPAAWALGSLWSRRLPMPAGAMSTAAQMLCGGAAMLLTGLARGETWPTSPPANAVISLLYLVFFGSIVAFSAYGYLLRHVRPALATSYAYVNPVVALLLGTVLGGERFTLSHGLACALTVTGVLVVVSRRAAPSPGSVSTNR